MLNLAGQVVFITGASRGIGAAAVDAFVGAGARVVLFARNHTAMKEVAQPFGENVCVIQGDVSQADDINAAIIKAQEHFGRLDVLINNAATLDPISHQDVGDIDQWSKLIDVNVKGVFYANRAALPIMIDQGSGTIITVGSGAANNALEGWSAYCTSKAAVSMLSKCTDLEYRHKGIRAMTLSPGTVATQMQREIKQSGLNPVSQLDWSDHIPPDWPAKALVWMCSPKADPYVGQEIRLKDPVILKALGLA